MVVHKHQLRPTDFRIGKRLGAGDHVVQLSRPPRPEWLSDDAYAALPEELVLREVRVRVKQRGFRTKTLVVVTTLVDSAAYTAHEIAELYRRRWQAELHLRSLKVVLQMDHLRCKTPRRVRNELQIHLLAYNAVRRAMALGSSRRECSALANQLQRRLQTLSHFLPGLACSMPLDIGCRTLVASITAHRVGNRPNRFEPRRIKRRPKSQALLQRPRHEYKRLAA